MRRAGRKKKPLTIQPIKCVVMLSSDEENDCIAAEKKENKQLKRIMEFADNNNLIPMKVFRRGIFGRRLRDEVFYKAIRYIRTVHIESCIGRESLCQPRHVHILANAVAALTRQ